MKLSVAAIVVLAAVAKASVEADTEQNRKLHGYHYKKGCCMFTVEAEFCEDPPGEKDNWCSANRWLCESKKCNGFWSPTCEKKELPGCCYQPWGGNVHHGKDWYDDDKDWKHDDKYYNYRKLGGGWSGSHHKGGCSDSCWCNVNPHNCWTCSGRWFPVGHPHPGHGYKHDHKHGHKYVHKHVHKHADKDGHKDADWANGDGDW